MYDTILFDLDGTLTDPGLGITNSVMYALERMEFPVPPRQELYKFIGPPLVESFQMFCGMDEAQALEAVRQYRVYFPVKGLYENEVYEGIVPMLQKLSGAGKRLVLATSKPEVYAKTIMAHFSLDRYVTCIAGATMGPGRNQKGQVIAYALEEFGIDPETAVMVGDREHDVLGAKENGLSTIGVTFGYGSGEELLAAGAARLAGSPEELTQILMEESV